MQVNFEIKLKPCGERVLVAYEDGFELCPYQASRALTGTVDEEFAGIFVKGEHSKRVGFYVEGSDEEFYACLLPTDPNHLPCSEVHENIKRNIASVKRAIEKHLTETIYEFSIEV